MPHISPGCGGGGFQVTGASVTVYRKNETSSKASKLALMDNFMQLPKIFSFMTSFITYNFRFQISPFSIRRLRAQVTRYWGQSPDTLHDTVHDQCTTTPRAREIIVNMAP